MGKNREQVFSYPEAPLRAVGAAWGRLGPSPLPGSFMNARRVRATTDDDPRLGERGQEHKKV